MTAADDRWRSRLTSLELVLLDVDGVLTDGRLHYGPDGDHGRSFHVRDGTAMKLAEADGLALGVLSGRTSPAVERRARELGLSEIHLGHADKLPVWQEVLRERELDEAQVAFMGDDVLDLPLLRRAGVAAAPADAAPEVLDAVDWASSRPGGAGCVRDFLELVLKARGSWTRLVHDAPELASAPRTSR